MFLVPGSTYQVTLSVTRPVQGGTEVTAVATKAFVAGVEVLESH